MQPRDYQIDAVKSVYSYFENEAGNPIIAMPTGTGKSVVIAMLLQSIFLRYGAQKILILTHVKELIAQNCDKLLTLWPEAPAGIFSAGLNQKNYSAPIVFAGVGSIAKKAKLFKKVDLILIDECHLVSPNDETQYRYFIDDLKKINPAIKIIGLSATPWRLGLGSLTNGGLFTDLCFDITAMSEFNKLIADGFLSPLIPKRTSEQLDVSKVGTSAGEFKQGDLQIAVDKESITIAAIKETLKEANNRNHILVFASGVEHAINIKNKLIEMGESARVVHSKMSNDERDKNILSFKRGDCRFVVNNNVLTTGFDSPFIDCIVVLRPTKSPVLWVQMLGRGTRPCEGKANCLVLDFAGNTARLGPINDPVLPKPKGDKAGGAAPIKLCPNCATYNHATLRFCVSCNHEFKFEIKIKQTSGTHELIKNDTPVVERIRVSHVTYSLHRKLGKPNAIKVAYFSHYQSYTEYVCPDHDGFAKIKAREWWGLRFDSEMPNTEIALTLLPNAKSPSFINVWINKKYPEVMSCEFLNQSYVDIESINTDNPNYVNLTT
jgi:DNA repair protein RadD